MHRGPVGVNINEEIESSIKQQSACFFPLLSPHSHSTSLSFAFWSTLLLFSPPTLPRKPPPVFSIPGHIFRAHLRAQGSPNGSLETPVLMHFEDLDENELGKISRDTFPPSFPYALQESPVSDVYYNLNTNICINVNSKMKKSNRRHELYWIISQKEWAGKKWAMGVGRLAPSRVHVRQIPLNRWSEKCVWI